MNLAFLACVEAGNLENQAGLLVRSIRKYAGDLREAPVHLFRPRPGQPLREETIALCAALAVELHEEPLNLEYGYYPISNKIFCGAWAEANLSEEFLVFTDSDTVFLNPPAELLLEGRFLAAVRPVNRKNRGSAGPGDPRDPYWEELYRLCGVRQRPYVETAVDRAPVRGYWNAGLVAVRRSAGLFGQWLEDFRTLMRASHFPPPRKVLNNMDQLSLAATLARVSDALAPLDFRYNYPLPLRAELPGGPREARLEELVHAHYYRWFNTPGFLESLQPPLDPAGEVFAWLRSFLPFKPILDPSDDHRKFPLLPEGLEKTE